MPSPENDLTTLSSVQSKQCIISSGNFLSHLLRCKLHNYYCDSILASTKEKKKKKIVNLYKQIPLGKMKEQIIDWNAPHF